MLKTKNVKTYYISKGKFSKKSKTQNLPPKTSQNQKSNKCSSELMLKTKSVQMHKISKEQFQKIQKLKNYSLKPKIKREGFSE